MCDTVEDRRDRRSVVKLVGNGGPTRGRAGRPVIEQLSMSSDESLPIAQPVTKVGRVSGRQYDHHLWCSAMRDVVAVGGLWQAKDALGPWPDG